MQNIRIRIKYTKGEPLKFLSHKDLMRAVQRAIRRADLPITFSQGFNPHMKISWGQALKVGQTSSGEHAELQFDKWINPREIMQRLNKELPSGLEVLEAHLV
jgi:radical SAM-linked protein